MTSSTTRHLMVGLTMMVLVGGGRPAFVAGAKTPAVSRVRSGSLVITALIQQASERSKTFRALVDAINASDGIVCVEEGRCGHGAQACFVNVTVSGPNAFSSPGALIPTPNDVAFEEDRIAD